MKRTGLSWVAAVTVLVVGCSKTDSTKTQGSEPSDRPAAVGTGGASTKDAKNDPDFVHDVAIMNMAEIELSRMALGKATSPALKDFTQKVIDDHGAAGEKLKMAVTGDPIDWPAQLDEKRRETAQELAKKQGADFDRDYAKAMVEGHQDLAAKLESRLDVQSLGEWKAAAAGRTRNKALSANIAPPDWATPTIASAAFAGN